MSRHRCDFSENPRDKKKTPNHTLAFVYPLHFSQDLRRSRVVGTHALVSLSSPNSWQFTDVWSTMTLAGFYTAKWGKLWETAHQIQTFTPSKYPPHPLWERAWHFFVFDHWISVRMHLIILKASHRSHWITKTTFGGGLVKDGFWPESTNM